MRIAITTLLLSLWTAPIAASPTTNYCGNDCLCVADTNSDGDYAGEGEIESCDSYADGELCPLDREPCSSESVIDPATGQPATEFTCPADEAAACLDDGSGTRYCSANPCFEQSGVVTTDTDIPTPPAGEGTVTAGECNGHVSIFGGKPGQCRKQGTQTQGQNCCINRVGRLQDTVGADGEKRQQEYKEESNNFELFGNQCSDNDQKTAQLVDSDYCVYVGSYCKERWEFIGCVQRARSYCCYNSKLSKMIQEQGRAQLPAMAGFGSPTTPQCRGFTIEEFQALDMSKMDFSAYANDLRHRNQAEFEAEVNANVPTNY